MNFDGSCAKNNVGVGIWIHNTENNHVEGHSCWPDKSFLWTRSISLVSEDNLATNEQLSLSFSKYIRFTNKFYEGVDPTLDPNAYLWL